MAGRPINFVLRNSTRFSMSGVRFVQSQFWTMAVFNASDVLFENIYINSTSNSSVRTLTHASKYSRSDKIMFARTQASTLNTDGIDTFYTNNITIRNWTIVNGDDAVSPKANTSNMMVQDSTFYDGSGIAIGSIGQYPGMYEFIENVTAERITTIGTNAAAYVKTWTGVEKGVPPNGGGGGLGFARNIGAYAVFVYSFLFNTYARAQCSGISPCRISARPSRASHNAHPLRAQQATATLQPSSSRTLHGRAWLVPLEAARSLPCNAAARRRARTLGSSTTGVLSRRARVGLARLPARMWG
jgi:polygalacturonase